MESFGFEGQSIYDIFDGCGLTATYAVMMKTPSFDDFENLRARAAQTNPWCMYFVVAQDRRLTHGQALALGGAGAVACAERFRAYSPWQDAFTAWYEESYRKVALRATAEDFARVGRELDVATISTAQGPTLLALPPRRKSTREAILRGLSVFTDARLPTPPTTTSEEANTNGLALTYVIRQGIMKSMGKAMAQGGHAALMCRDRFSTTYAEEFAAWREQGYGGRVYSTDDLTWEQLKVESECVVVVDAGLTQVDPGTETVLAFPPTTSLGQAPLTRIP